MTRHESQKLSKQLKEAAFSRPKLLRTAFTPPVVIRHFRTGISLTNFLAVFSKSAVARQNRHGVLVARDDDSDKCERIAGGINHENHHTNVQFVLGVNRRIDRLFPIEKLPPQMIVVGGPNGAGKTTFVRETQARESILYIGADQIAAELSPDDPAKAAISAGREFVARVNLAILREESFIFETTLSGKSFLNTVRNAKDQGYWVAMQMVFVDSPARSIRRVANRVREGGHHVPDDDVIRRFPRSLQNFWLKYRFLANEWLPTYNTESRRVDVARLSPGRFEILDERNMNLFFELAELDRDC